MIKVLELESSLGFGGQEHRTQRVINELAKSGEFEFYYGLNDGAKSLEKPINCEFVKFNLKRSYNVLEIFRIARFVRKNGINLIATHSGKDGIIGTIVGLITITPVVRTRHLQTPISNPLSYNLSTHVVAVSNATKSALTQKGVKADKISVIHTGVDTQKYSPNFTHDIKAELGLGSDCVAIGCVAVLRGAKRINLLIKAFASLAKTNPNTALIIAGDGPQMPNLKPLAQKIGNVYMLGNRDDVASWLGSLDIFVLPSRMEALGTALLEAASCGVACVGARVGGIKEAIKDSKSGLLFDDEKELEAALKRLCDNERLRKDMGAFGREYVKQGFSIEAMAGKTAKLYKRLKK